MEIEPGTIAQVKAMKGGRMVLIEDDVHNVARDLREIDPSLRLRWSEKTELFVVYELTDTGEKLVTTATECDQRLVDRIRQIAQPGYDYAAEIERNEREADAANDAKRLEIVGDVGERLAWALRKDLGERKPDYVRGARG